MGRWCVTCAVWVDLLVMNDWLQCFSVLHESHITHQALLRSKIKTALALIHSIFLLQPCPGPAVGIGISASPAPDHPTPLACLIAPLHLTHPYKAQANQTCLIPMIVPR